MKLLLRTGKKKWAIACLCVGLAILSLAGWSQRASLLVWYRVYSLARADESDLPTCVEAVIELEAAAIPQLLHFLSRPEEQACAHVHVALERIRERWPPDDARLADLTARLAEAFSGFSVFGQREALGFATSSPRGIQNENMAEELYRCDCAMISLASRVADTTVHAQALALAARTLDQSPKAERLLACRELARACLRDSDAKNRILGTWFAVRPGMEISAELVEGLSDPDAEVRRNTILAIGSRPETISTDELLPWLHDPDEDVRCLCEKALRSRGLTDDHVQLGRLMTDSRANSRLQVLDLLRQANDLEPGVWLKRLSHDSEPAVRAGAVRAAIEQRVASLDDRLHQMAQNDPCATVRQLTQYYLTALKSRATENALSK